MTNAISPPRIIRRKEVESRVGLARSTIYERIQQGSFPAPVSLGSKAVGWVESEVTSWLEEQIARSRKSA
jgi:prophage regulatory protein